MKQGLSIKSLVDWKKHFIVFPCMLGEDYLSLVKSNVLFNLRAQV